MSIAVTAVVQHSRMLRLAVVVMGAIGIAAAMLLAFGGADAKVPLPQWVRGVIALLIIAGVVQTVRHHLRVVAPVTIDISAAGTIRLSGALHTVTPPTASGEPCCWNLLPGTTISEYCMILRLENTDGQHQTLMVLPDTVPPTSFRALAVACRWIAAHNNRARSENA
jgi:toxin CptA